MTLFARPGFLKRFSKTDVTICIPAYNSASFIDRALRCAQGQTYPHVRILVSIDKSDDDTAGLCRRFASGDSRIDVIEHRARLGWCANINALLERVDTPFFFIYFHDDLILPQYCAHLRDALMTRPDAATANCDLLEFGLADALRPGRSYEGSVAKRILTLWGVRERGAPFRWMVRGDKLDENYRFPHEEQDSLTPGQTIHMRMVAAGPSIYVPETLYLRWNRKGGLIDKWGHLTPERAFEGWRDDAARVFALIDELVADPIERDIIKFAQTAFVLGALRRFYQPSALPSPSAIHPDAPSQVDLNATRDRFGTEIAERLGMLQADPLLPFQRAQL